MLEDVSTKATGSEAQDLEAGCVVKGEPSSKRGCSQRPQPTGCADIVVWASFQSDALREETCGQVASHAVEAPPLFAA